MIRARLVLLLVLAFPFSLDGCSALDALIGILTQIAYGEREPLPDPEGEASGCRTLSCRNNPQCQLAQENGSFERSTPTIIISKVPGWFGDQAAVTAWLPREPPTPPTCHGAFALDMTFGSTFGAAVQKAQLYDVRAYAAQAGIGQVRVRALANFFTDGADEQTAVGIHLEAYRGDPAAIPLYDDEGNPFTDPETYPEDGLLQRLRQDVLLVPNLERWQPVETAWVLPEGTTFVLFKVEMRARANPSTRLFVDQVRVALDGGPYPPLTADDWATTYEDLPVATVVTFNDTDYDGVIDLSSLTIIDPPGNGTITAIEPGLNDVQVTYTPNPGFVGLDAYSYRVADDEGNVSGKAIVTISVREGSPSYDLRVVKQALPTRRFFDQTAADLAAAGDTLTYTVFVTNAGPGPARDVVVEDRLPPALTTDSPTLFATPPAPSQGTYVFDQGARTVTWTLGSLAPGAQGRLTMQLQPNAAASGGPYTNTARIIQGLGGDTDPRNDAATATIHVNVRPLARHDTAAATTNTPLPIAVLANDEDPDGALNPAALFLPGGQLSDSGFGVISVPIPADGTLTYTPTQGYTGTDTFRYVVRDDQGAASNDALVTVEVNN